MIQAVFFDFDQTLFSHKTMSIPQSAKDAIAELHKKGILCVLATGRHRLELDRFPEVYTIGLDGYVTIDGQICLDKDRNILCANAFEGKRLENLLKVFHDKEIPTMLVEKDRMYLNISNEKQIQGLGVGLAGKHPIMEYTGNPVYLGISYIRPEQEAWFSTVLPDCNFLRWSDAGVDITPAGRDKISGIHEYLDYYGIPRDSYMAFGDGDNDTSMIASAPIGVAMGNALSCVKEVADYITSSIDEDGIWNALKHFGLI